MDISNSKDCIQVRTELITVGIISLYSNRPFIILSSLYENARCRYRKDALIFESLRKKYGTDEIQAWVEYTKIKYSNNEPRDVIECRKYDRIGALDSNGRCTRERQKPNYFSTDKSLCNASRIPRKRCQIENLSDTNEVSKDGITDSKSNLDFDNNFFASKETASREGPAVIRSISGDSGDDMQGTASFSTSLQDLTSFPPLSKSNSVISNDVSDEEYKTLYHAEFGTFLSDGEVNVNWTWKELYDKIVDLKKGFISGITPTIIESTIGALRWEKEEAALFEDNPQIAPVDREISKGYTGLQSLNSLPKPPNSSNLWDPPLLLHGDFDGIKIYDSAIDFLCDKRREYISIGEEHGRVTALAVCKFLEVGESTANAPCCFIGYDSGSVASLTAALSDDGMSYNFSVEHHRHVHNSKVSAMTIMDCKSLSDGSHPDAVLLSACYDGQVFYYPNALNPECGFDMTHTPAFSNSHPDLCPILTMTSTAFVENDKQFCLVCTGDREGSVRLWLAKDDLLEGKPSSEAAFNQVKWYKSKGKHCVTMAKFVNSYMLVSGNNQGDIRIWNLITMDETDEDFHDIVPGLTLFHSFKHAHNGPVETAMSLGDVIITSGGNDGNLFGWDATSGKQLGAISCHYGQETFDETTGEKGVVKSCVVGAQVVNNRLISLCRDGVLAEWRFSFTQIDSL